MSAELRKIDCEPPGADILSRIEELREAAEKGELSAIAIAVVYRDGSAGRATSTMHSYSTMIGSIELLKLAVIDNWKAANP